MNSSIPIKLLYEAQGLEIRIETVNGKIYTGNLKEVDVNMNLILESGKVFLEKNTEVKFSNVVIRGSNIKFFILPPALKFAPFFDIEKKLMNDD